VHEKDLQTSTPRAWPDVVHTLDAFHGKKRRAPVVASGKKQVIWAGRRWQLKYRAVEGAAFESGEKRQALGGKGSRGRARHVGITCWGHHDQMSGARVGCLMIKNAASFKGNWDLANESERPENRGRRRLLVRETYPRGSEKKSLARTSSWKPGGI